MSAIELLTKAIEYDINGRKMESLKLYQGGISLLLKQCQDETDLQKKKHYQFKIEEYMTRAEKLKVLVNTTASRGSIIDKIAIIDGATGFSYERVFGKYLDKDVREVCLEEPYIREHYQFYNLVMFCELLVLKCQNLKFINITTVKDEREPSRKEQQKCFTNLTESLKPNGISLHIDFSPSLHDRQIILSNGYVVKIGRGLHYFKPQQIKYTLGTNCYAFRECKETNIDIFFCSENKRL